jgi:hypothetical protein
VARSAGRRGIPHTERTLLACFLPAALFHDHPDQHSDCLAESLAAAWMNSA